MVASSIWFAPSFSYGSLTFAAVFEIMISLPRSGFWAWPGVYGL